MFIVWSDEPALSETLTSMGFGNSVAVVWPTDPLWIATALVAGLAVVFIIGKSPRSAIATSVAALLLGLAGTLAVGRCVAIEGSRHVTSQGAFPTPWAALLFWALSAPFCSAPWH